MNLQEQESYAQEYATRMSYVIHSKLPEGEKVVFEPLDIAQEMLETYYRYRHHYDPEKPFKPWIHKVIQNQGTDTIIRVWDSHVQEKKFHDPEIDTAKEFSGEEGDGNFEYVIVNYDDPERLYEITCEKEEMKEQLQIMKSDITNLSKRFKIEFTDGNYLGALSRILKYTLNDMTDKEFHALPIELQRRLAKYGEALETNSVIITATGRIKSKGITAVIREAVQSGKHEWDEVKAILDKKGMMYTEGSARVVLWDEKKRAGIPLERKNKGIKEKVMKLFDYGRGITTVGEMFVELDRLGYSYSPSTIRTYLQEMRKLAGLTKK